MGVSALPVATSLLCRSTWWAGMGMALLPVRDVSTTAQRMAKKRLPPCRE